MCVCFIINQRQIVGAKIVGLQNAECRLNKIVPDFCKFFKFLDLQNIIGIQFPI